MGFLVFLLYIGALALGLWINYKIQKAAIKNALDESVLGEYFRNKRNGL